MKKFLRIFGIGKKSESEQEKVGETLPAIVTPPIIGRDSNNLPSVLPQAPRKSPAIKLFNLVEVSEYNLDLRMVQNPEKEWVYCLEFYPQQTTEIIDEEDMVHEEVVEGLGRIHRVQVDGILIYGRDIFTQWEYAAEAAIDIIELLGFVVANSEHVFDVLFWDNKKREHNIKVGIYDGADFSLMSEK